MVVVVVGVEWSRDALVRCLLKWTLGFALRGLTRGLMCWLTGGLSGQGVVGYRSPGASLGLELSRLEVVYMTRGGGRVGEGLRGGELARSFQKLLRIRDRSPWD